jgi:hypothetical protein
MSKTAIVLTFVVAPVVVIWLYALWCCLHVSKRAETDDNS